MLRNFATTSVFILALQRIQRACYSISGQLYKIFIESQTHRLIIKFWDATRAGFRYSFLSEILNTERDSNYPILDNSQFARWLSAVFATLRFRIVNYQMTSEVIKTTAELKQEVHSSPFKAIGIVLSAASSTDILFSLLFNREMKLTGWIFKAIFLSIGIGSLYINADWKTVKETSIFFKVHK